jgi:hypothetical protein
MWHNFWLCNGVQFHNITVCSNFSSVHVKTACLHSGTVRGKYCLRSSECWDRRFESCSGHGCVSAFPCVMLSCVGRGLGSADHPSKVSYQLSNWFTIKNPSTPQGKRGRLRKKKERRTWKLQDTAQLIFTCFLSLSTPWLVTTPVTAHTFPPTIRIRISQQEAVRR